MQCHEFEDRMQTLLDSRLPPEHDAILCDHAGACAGCAQMLHAQQQLFNALSRPMLPPTRDFATAVVQQHAQARSVQLQFRRRLSWGLAFTSALAITWLAVSGRLIPKPSSPNVPSEQHLVVQPTSPASLAHQAPARSPFDQRKTAEKLGQYREVIVSLAHQISESSDLDHVGATLEPGLRPLQSSFGLAIDALRRTLPRGREEREVRPKDGALKIYEMPLLM
jgi:hypothetical protein